MNIMIYLGIKWENVNYWEKFKKVLEDKIKYFYNFRILVLYFMLRRGWFRGYYGWNYG